MSSTATVYINRINKDFPVKGKDNDSQGFRDNYDNIIKAITAVNDHVEDIDLYAIKTNTTATFLGNTFEDVNFRNSSQELYEYDQQNGYISINYELGHYHKFTVGAGSHTIAVSNWPDGRVGRLYVSITTPASVSAEVEFSNTISTGPENNPFDLLPGDTTIFEVWNEGGQNQAFVKKVNDFVYDGSTTTTRVWVDELLLGNIGDADSSNLFTTGTNNVTVVSNNLQFGEVALVPNRITVNLGTGTTVDPLFTTGTVFTVNTTTGIQPGAFLNFKTTSTTFYVAVGGVDNVNNRITTTQPFPVGIGGDIGGGTITFTNPQFTDQPIVVTQINTEDIQDKGRLGVHKGTIYAERYKFKYTFAEEVTTASTFAITTMATSTQVYNTSTDLATANFVHNLLPFGSVIMWYGAASSVPNGWAICDGRTLNTGTWYEVTTPNLTNRFVIGANTDDGTTATSNITGTNAIVGGWRDTDVVSHNHSTTVTTNSAGTPTGSVDVAITDPGHFHLISENANSQTASGGTTTGQVNPEPNTPKTDTAQTGITASASFSGNEMSAHSHSVTVANTGTSGTYKNIPPFYALYYIMKVTGKGSFAINV